MLLHVYFEVFCHVVFILIQYCDHCQGIVAKQVSHVNESARDMLFL